MNLPKSSGSPSNGLDMVVWWLAYAALVAIVVVVVAAQVDASATMQVVSNVVTFFASMYLSFVITRHYAQITAREELKRLAEAAGSRIFLLAVQMRQVAGELRTFDREVQHTGQFVESVAIQIDRLSAQADLSVEDLERISDVELSLPAMRDAAQSRVEAATKGDSDAVVGDANLPPTRDAAGK